MKKNKKLLASLLALSVVATGAFTTVAVVDGKNKQAGNTVGTGNMLTGGNGMEIETNDSSNIRMTSKSIPKKQYASHGVSPQAESAYTITATITPEYMADLVELEWSVEFRFPNSEWAKGKDPDEYVKVTAVGELGHQAIVECLQPFGAAIIVKAVAKNDPDITGSCVCHYLDRYEIVNAKWDNGDSIQFKRGEVTSYAFGAIDEWEGKITFAGLENCIGSNPETYFGLTMEINEVLIEALENHGFAINSTVVDYGSRLYEPQMNLHMYGYETMLYLPGADAAILGEERSEWIKQGRLWTKTGTNDDGVLSQEEIDTYNRYRDAIIEACRNSDDLLTLRLTQYTQKTGGDVLVEYEMKIDMGGEELIPALSVKGIQFDFGNLDF